MTVDFLIVPAFRIFCTDNFYLPHHQGLSIDELSQPDIPWMMADY
jgi:hypothetical protein